MGSRSMTDAEYVLLGADILIGRSDKKMSDIPVHLRTLSVLMFARTALEEGAASAKRQGGSFFNFFPPTMQMEVFNELVATHAIIEEIMLSAVVKH